MKLHLCEIDTIEVQDVGSEIVYDIEVEEDHSYVVNSTVVHNSVCTTRLQTGFTCPQFTAVQRCSSVANVPIIADGGIKHIGDIAKSLVAGATMAMAGGMFAGHEECPGEVETIDGKLVKEYYGSASEFNKGHEEYVEGKKIIIDYKGPVERTMRQIEHGLQSAISYAGGNDLSAFLTTDYVIQQ
jgi:GMP reductase